MTRSGRDQGPAPDLQTFGKNVRRIRMDKGLSQEELAQLAGLDRTYISSLENGNRNTALLNVYAIAAALNCEPGDLVNKPRDR